MNSTTRCETCGRNLPEGIDCPKCVTVVGKSIEKPDLTKHITNFDLKK